MTGDFVALADPITTPAVDPDAALLERCRAGDEAAVRALTRRHNQRLFRVARGILRDDTEAEDVVQETYVRAFLHLDRFRGEAAVGTWLARIAVNEALARLRRRRPTVDVETVPAEAPTPDPETTMAQRELRAILERAIDALPDAFRSVFVARLVEGLSVEETADLFGLRPETVKTRVHRARQRLRAALTAELGASLDGAFSFDGARCERLTEAVVARVRAARAGVADGH